MKSKLAVLALACNAGVAACSGATPEASTTAAPASNAAAAPAAQGTPPRVTASAPPAAAPAPATEGRPAAANAAPRDAAVADAGDALRAEIQRLIGSAACRDDSQCRALPMGAKPCGGPEAYLAWSTALTDARQLEALAARYKEARVARNQRLGLMSDCAVVGEPPLRCVPNAAEALGGRCETLSTRGVLPPSRADLLPVQTPGVG